ncbi:MAG: cation:proton antiporter, partial [Pseudomonadota bacterium]
MSDFLLQASLFLGAGLVAVPLAMRFGLGSVLGYLLAGLFIGPALGLVGDITDVQHFAEFGVVMMLFIIGLELDPKALWAMRNRLVGLGGLQIAVSAGLIAAAALALGFEWRTATAIGLIFALSSTAIVLQTLAEKGLMATAGGRSAFSVLLAQDIAVIPFLAFLPLLAVSPEVLGATEGLLPFADPAPSDAGHGDDHGDGHGDAHGDDHGSAYLLAGLPQWGVTLI